MFYGVFGAADHESDVISGEFSTLGGLGVKKYNLFNTLLYFLGDFRTGVLGDSTMAEGSA